MPGTEHGPPAVGVMAASVVAATGWLRPLALTGELDYRWSDKPLKVIGTDPGTGGALFNNGGANLWEGGLTPQYTGLERLHEQFAGRGFSVVGCGSM